MRKAYLEQLRRFKISIESEKKKRELGIFFCLRSSVRLREDLAELRQGRLPQAEISVLALPLQATQHFIEELLMRAQRVLAGPLAYMSPVLKPLLRVLVTHSSKKVGG